jgi:predicted HTH transcriptional regulator
MEQKIEQTKNSYYSSLKTSSEGWEVNQNDALPFAEYFITTLFLCYKDLDAFFVSFRDQKVNKTQRIETAVLNSLLPISKRELARLLPDVSVTTIETVLGKLVREDKITKIGQGPLTQYLRKSE